MASVKLSALLLTVYGVLFIALGIGANQPHLAPYFGGLGLVFLLLAYGMISKGMVSLKELASVRGIATIIALLTLVIYGLKFILAIFGIDLPFIDFLAIEHLFIIGAVLMGFAAVELRG